MEKVLLVIDSLAVDTPVEELSEKLAEIINYVWKTGLTEEYFSKLVKIFISKDDLNLTQRKVILDCLVPNFVIKDDIMQELLLWFFSFYLKEETACSHFLLWIAGLLENKLTNVQYLERFFGQLVTCFQSECLVSPLCRVLVYLCNERTVNKRTCYLIQEFSQEFIKNDFGPLIWEVKKFHPEEIRSGLKFEPLPKGNKTNFERALEKIRKKLGVKNSYVRRPKICTSGSLPVAEYYWQENDLTKRKMSDVTSTSELGRCIRKQNLIFPDNPGAILTTRMGMIYLELMGPSEEFLYCLQGMIEANPSPLCVSKLCELQNRMRHGLPIITKYLSDYLITWDGIDNQNLVFGLMNWIYFDTFSELSSMILIPITRLFVCSSVETMLQILHSIESLLVNMMSSYMMRFQLNSRKSEFIPVPSWLVDPVSTFKNLCHCVQSLLQTGLMLQGLDSSAIILQAFKFYNTIISLQLKFKLICLIHPLPLIMYSAFTSMNYVVLSEAGALIIQYKKKVIPLLCELEVAEQFSEEINIINEISENLFSYLWLGKSMSGNVSQHTGVFPLIEFLANKLKLDVNKLKEEDVLLMLLNYSEGLGEFIQYHINEYDL